MDGMGFFKQLWTFSERYVTHAGLESNHSPWGYDEYDGGKPKGAVLHFTADEDFHRVLRWFQRAKYQSKSSSEVVVADCKMPKHDECAEGLPLIQALPVTVVMCRRLGEAGWHATWTNKMCFGIENVCAGEIRSVEGDFVTWRPRDRSAADWTMPWEPAVQKNPLPLFDRWWSPYPRPQVEANITILQNLQDVYGSLTAPWVVGHELVQGTETGRRPTDKRDPGPGFPIHLVRAAVFGATDEFLAGLWSNYESVVDGYEWRERIVQRWAASLISPNIVLETTAIDAKVAWARLRSSMEVYPAESNGLGYLGRAMFTILGYNFSGSLGPDALGDGENVYLFQRLMGLTADRDPGPKTRAALVARFKDRGFLLA